MSPADRVLIALHKVKRTGPSRWIACCPAHDDSHPSLGVRELDDGRLLLKCWGGCAADEVVGAIGLSFADLFPVAKQALGGGHPRERRPWSAADLIDLAAHEAGVAVIVASDLAHGRVGADLDRLLVAAGRLADVAEAVHGRR